MKLSFKNEDETPDFCVLYGNLEKNVTPIFYNNNKTHWTMVNS